MVCGLYAFNALPLNERAEALWSDGVFLMATDHPGGRSAFYAYADYFVEVLLVGAPERVAEVVPFYTGPRLERLLSVIDVSKL